MYAIIVDGGRQYRVEEGQLLDLDYREVSPGESITLDRVLAARSGDTFKLGDPTVAGASVTAEVIGLEQGDKVRIFKYRRRKNSRRTNGHRQLYTRVKISKINA